jgi:hypothetical protein
MQYFPQDCQNSVYGQKYKFSKDIGFVCVRFNKRTAVSINDSDVNGAKNQPYETGAG